MSILCYILFFSMLGSIGAVLGASLILFLPERYRWKFILVFVSYATGTLLSSALLGMIPKAMKRSASPLSISATILAGIMLFFFLEKLVIWRHCHERACPESETGNECYADRLQIQRHFYDPLFRSETLKIVTILR